MANQKYAAFKSSKTLYDLNRNIHSNLLQGVREPQNKQVNELLDLFIDECMDFYYLRPMDQVKLSDMGCRIVTGGVGAIKKTSKLAIGQITKKLGNDDLLPIANYIDSIVMHPPAGQDHPIYVAVPISNMASDRLFGATTKGREQGPHTVAAEFSEALCKIIDDSIEQYFDVPLSLLKLGFVMEKVARVATDAGRAAAHTVVRKVPSAMSEPELLAFFDFAESILIERPA